MVNGLAFTKLNCACQAPLFSKKYLRSHRTNGSKVLRCFPHCCPTHVEGTYCGSALAVVVTVASPSLLSQCTVDLRIESSNDTTMACGDTIESDRIVLNRRMPSNPSAEWLPTTQVAADASTTTFECNPIDGWNYGWKGGSSIHQRLSWHRIKAYVFMSDPDHPERLKVIATVASPPFFVMSYRRSCKACQTNEAMGSCRDNCDCAGVFRLNDGLLQRVLSTGTIQVDMLPFREPETAHPTSKSPPIPIAEHELVLRMMFAVLSHLHIPTAESALRGLLRCFDTTSMKESAAFFPPKTHSTSCDAVKLCVHIVVVVLVHGRQDLRQFMATYACDLLHQDRLWHRYELWLQLVHTKINAALAAQHTSRESFVQSLATSCRAIDPSIMTSSTAAPPVFEFFVAQLREVYMARATAPSLGNGASPFDGSWDLDVKSIRVDVATASAPSVLGMLRWFSMGRSFDQCVENPATLCVMSSLAVFPTDRAEFVLDHLPRVFRVFPNGETSMSNCGGLTYGDYMGALDGNSLRLDLFCWSATPPRTCHVVRLQSQLDASNRLLVSVEVAVHAGHIVAEDFDAWTPAERVAELQRRCPLGAPWVRVVGMYDNRRCKS